MKRLRRRGLLSVIALAPAATASWVWAQPAKRPRIGYLSGRSLSMDGHLLKAFKAGLETAGFVDGRSVTIDARWADGHFERLPAMAADLAHSQPDLIASVGGTPVTVAVKAATSTIPVVFTIGADPIALGLVDTLARPGGTMTGMTLLSASLEGKRIDLLREMLPNARSIALLANPVMPGIDDMVRDAQRTAKALGLDLQILKARSEAEIDQAFQALPAGGTDGLAVTIDGFFISQRDRILALSAARRLPTIFPSREFTDAGGLASYGTSWGDIYRAAGGYAGRILKGAAPKDLPVQEPNSYELVVNLKTAKALGLALSPTFVGRADAVIE